MSYGEIAPTSAAARTPAALREEREHAAPACITEQSIRKQREIFLEH